MAGEQRDFGVEGEGEGEGEGSCEPAGWAGGDVQRESRFRTD